MLAAPHLTFERVLIRLSGGVVVAAGLTAILVLLNVVVTFVAWKVAALTDLVLAVWGPVIWAGAPPGAWMARVVAATVTIAAIGLMAALGGTWTVHAAHDARLAAMSDEVCDVRLPAGAAVHDCHAGITNSGNGNSCKYEVVGTVRGASSTAAVTASLREAGFTEVELDHWSGSAGDGLGYWRDPDDPVVMIYSTQSYEPYDGDLRCT